MIIITSVLFVAAAATAVYFNRQNSKLHVTIFEKEAVIEALQTHSRKVESVLDSKKEEIKKLKSEIQSMIDKAKAASKPKTSGASVTAVTAKAAPAKAKRKYNKKTA
jgi:predicted Holliday junction resolvase-like endonuclease